MLLIFKTGKYDVATTAWSARSNGDSVDIAYVWGADGISWFDSATGVCRVAFQMTMTQFLSYRSGNVIDLR